MDNIDAMLERLEGNPVVTGLIRYGSDHKADGYSVGDYDLFVVFSADAPPIEGLHFDAGHTPVDLNFITLAALKGLTPEPTFPQVALADGMVIFDRTGEVELALHRLKESLAERRPKTVSEHAVAFLRHGHRHVLDKLRGRLESEPLLVRFLLGVNPYWLMDNYFRVRNLPFKGEAHALRYWRENEPDIYQALEAFYATKDLKEQVQLTERLTELVLAPVGGAWQRGEILAFGHPDSHNLTEQGEQVYRGLFGREDS